MTAFTYEWNINDLVVLNEIKNASFKQLFRSPIFVAFGYKWCLEVYPNGGYKKGDVELYLTAPAYPVKLKSIHIMFTLRCLQTNTKYSYTTVFDKDRKSFGWPKETLSTQTIQSCHTLTFAVTLESISVYDGNDNDVTVSFDRGSSMSSNISKEDNAKKSSAKTKSGLGGGRRVSVGVKNDKNTNTVRDQQQLIMAQLDSLAMNMETMMQKMNQFETRLDEEQKEKEKNEAMSLQLFSQLQTQINLMQARMKKLELNVNVDPEQQKLKAWLDSTDGLADYYNVFIGHDITDFSALSLMNMQDIENMGIDNLQHQMLILRKVLELNQSNKNQL